MIYNSEENKLFSCCVVTACKILVDARDKVLKDKKYLFNSNNQTSQKYLGKLYKFTLVIPIKFKVTGKFRFGRIVI